MSSATRYAVGDLVWLPHDTESYVPGRVESVSASRLDVRALDDSATVVKISLQGKDARNVDHCGGHLNDNVDNLIELDELSEAAILYHIRKRFAKKQIYTSVGSILVAVNPFEPLSIYSQADIDRAKKATQPYPHVFCTAATAYKQLRENRKNQAVLISGESGAGKTETTKKVLTYLAKVAVASHSSNNHANIEDKILQSNPLLEALGNAKTLRNNNSSRFGKWMEVQFNQNFQIEGGNITNYLLEKSRVVSQGPQERNYHIFYQLVTGADNTLRQRLGLGADPESYNYLNQSGCVKIEHVNDAKEFAEVLDSMKTLQFPDNLVLEIFQIISAVLLLGNIEFCDVTSSHAMSSDSPATISDMSFSTIQQVCSLLRIDESAFRFALTDKLVTMGRGSVVGIKMTIDGAIDARDALAKGLYGMLFDYLIIRVNETLAAQENNEKDNRKSSNNSLCIGILDIFGFEIFEHNSFEQLCINYANEKLQNHFNNVIFNEEIQMYIDEGFNGANDIHFDDNILCVNLIENRPIGILSFIDEECNLGTNGSETSLINKFDKNFGTNNGNNNNNKNTNHFNPFYQKVKTKPNAFFVKHFAGPVEYCVDGFLEKNKDTMNMTMIEVISQSNNSTVKAIYNLKFGSTSAAAVGTPAASGGKASNSGNNNSKASLGSQFRSQLFSLLQTLKTTETHFIRCLKSNNAKTKGKFESPLVLSQMSYSGLFDAIRIRKSGFAFRWNHEQFANSYRVILPDFSVKSGAGKVRANGASSTTAVVDRCNEILEYLKSRNVISEIHYFIGKTKVFLKNSNNQIALDRMKKSVIDKYVVTMQRIVRGFLGVRRRLNLQLIKAQELRLKKMSELRVFYACVLIQRVFRGYLVRQSLDTMRDIVAVRRLVAARDSQGLQLFLAKMELRLSTEGNKLGTRGNAHTDNNNNNNLKSSTDPLAMSTMTPNAKKKGVSSGGTMGGTLAGGTIRPTGSHTNPTASVPETGYLDRLLQREVSSAKTMLRLVGVQGQLLSSLKAALARSDVKEMNELIVKCERVDLGQHELVVTARRTLKSMHEKRGMVDKMMSFLEICGYYNTGSTGSTGSSGGNSLYSNHKEVSWTFEVGTRGTVKTSNLHALLNEDFVKDVESLLTRAKEADIDPDFVSKVERILSNLAPRLQLRDRIRRSIELIHVEEVLSGLKSLANFGGIVLSDDWLTSGQLSPNESTHGTNNGGSPAESPSDPPEGGGPESDPSEGGAGTILKSSSVPPAGGLLSRYRAMLSLIEYKPSLQFVETEMRAVRVLLGLLESERLIEGGTSSNPNSTTNSNLALSYDVPRLTPEIIQLCDDISAVNERALLSATITANSANNPNFALTRRLHEKCCENPNIIERVIRSYKWSRLLCVWKTYEITSMSSTSFNSNNNNNSIISNNNTDNCDERIVSNLNVSFFKVSIFDSKNSNNTNNTNNNSANALTMTSTPTKKASRSENCEFFGLNFNEASNCNQYIIKSLFGNNVSEMPLNNGNSALVSTKKSSSASKGLQNTNNGSNNGNNNETNSLGYTNYLTPKKNSNGNNSGSAGGSAGGSNNQGDDNASVVSSIRSSVKTPEISPLQRKLIESKKYLEIQKQNAVKSASKLSAIEKKQNWK